MPSYMFRDERGDIVTNAHDLAQPIPVHALTEAAEEGRVAVRSAAAYRLAARVAAEEAEPAPEPEADPWLVWRDVLMRTASGEALRVVTTRPRPGDPVTAGARLLERESAARGFETKLLVAGERCVVEGLHRGHRVGFHASWLRGAAERGTWHEPWRYEMVSDTRQVVVDQTARVGKKGYRSAGVGVEHLSIVATPWGISIGVTAVLQRVRGYDA